MHTTPDTERGGALGELAAELAGEGTLVSTSLKAPDRLPAPPAGGALGALAASGPRSASASDEIALAVESIREGYLLHYGSSRLFDLEDDPDLALLAADYLYAKGLERLAAAGDLFAVRELSDLIAASASLHATGDDAGEVEAAAIHWLATSVVLACGPSESIAEAKRELGESGDAMRLYHAARNFACTFDLNENLLEASQAVGFQPSDRG